MSSEAYYHDYFTGSSSSVPDNFTLDMMESLCGSKDKTAPGTGFPEVKMSSIYGSMPVDTTAGASFGIPLMTNPLVDSSVIKNYDTSIELAGLPWSGQDASFGNERLYTPTLNHCWTPEEESNSSGIYLNMECQSSESSALPLQAASINDVHEFRSSLHGSGATSGLSTTGSSSNRKGRDRSYDVQRRFMIDEKLQALETLLPALSKISRVSIQGYKESVIDNAISHIKYLELQLKELSANRLGGESISSPLVFVEGQGHYFYRREPVFDRPLEEVLGNLMEENPSAACKLLESKGLHMVPNIHVDELCRL